MRHMNNANTNVSEHGAIAKVVQHYIDGAKSGKGDDMKPAFHEDATASPPLGLVVMATKMEK